MIDGEAVALGDAVCVAMADGVAEDDSVVVPSCDAEGVMDCVLDELSVAPDRPYTQKSNAPK